MPTPILDKWKKLQRAKYELHAYGSDVIITEVAKKWQKYGLEYMCISYSDGAMGYCATVLTQTHNSSDMLGYWNFNTLRDFEDMLSVNGEYDISDVLCERDYDDRFVAALDTEMYSYDDEGKLYKRNDDGTETVIATNKVMKQRGRLDINQNYSADISYMLDALAEMNSKNLFTVTFVRVMNSGEVHINNCHTDSYYN